MIHLGKVEEIDWRDEDEDEDADDEELEETPKEVLIALGFDPKELDDVKSAKLTESWLLRESPRDVRQHLHDGVEYVDDITGVLNERTPKLVKPAAQQVLAAIEGAGSYDEARKALLSLYPQLERRPLRDALTGATLLAQAAGRLTAGREGK